MWLRRTSTATLVVCSRSTYRAHYYTKYTQFLNFNSNIVEWMDRTGKPNIRLCWNGQSAFYQHLRQAAIAATFRVEALFLFYFVFFFYYFIFHFVSFYSSFVCWSRSCGKSLVVLSPGLRSAYYFDRFIRYVIQRANNNALSQIWMTNERRAFEEFVNDVRMMLIPLRNSVL